MRICRVGALLILVLLQPFSAAADRDLTPDTIDDYVFVANRTSAEITVIDSRDDRIAWHLALPAIPDAFVLSATTAQLISAHLEDHTLAIHDLGADRADRIVELPFPPHELAVDPEGDFLIVASPNAAALALVSLTSADLVIHSLDGFRPGDIVFDRKGETVLVASAEADRVLRVDVASGETIDAIDLEEPVVDLIRTPGGQVGFALHGESGRVSVLDLKAYEHAATVTLPGPARRGFPTGNSLHALIPNARDESVSMISSWTRTEVDRLRAGAEISGINAGMFDSVAFALDRGKKEAIILDLDRREQTGAIPLPGTPETAVTAQAGTKLYVALSDSRQLAVIDMRTRELIALIDNVGTDPWAVNRAGGLSYCH